jgi:pimeloyl-ACP methyl ester carboxylesterase
MRIKLMARNVSVISVGRSGRTARSRRFPFLRFRAAAVEVALGQAEAAAPSARIDVRDSVARIQCPTIVFHTRQCANVPISAGRAVAEAIADARFIELDSANEVPLADEDAWRQYIATTRSFLEDRPQPRAYLAT